MSIKKINEIQKKIEKAETFGAPVIKKNQKTKEYGGYQLFQKECMKKVDNKPDSPSRIEVITGKEGIHSTERLVQCSVLWGKYRNSDNPVNGLMNELKIAQKIIKGENP